MSVSDTLCAVLFIMWLFISTFATVGCFFCTNDFSFIQCKVLDKKVLSGSE